MKALRKLYAREGIWLADEAMPTYSANELLIKIKHTAICGTDIHIYNWDDWAQKNVPVPLTIGHEFMGTVVAMGDQVAGFQIGDRVSGEGHLTCGICRNCRTGFAHCCAQTEGIGYHRVGCFAEYFVLPASNAVHLPESIPDEIGAILDPLGNSVHTALSFDLVGENVLITGAGPTGILAAMVARKAGAGKIVITDIHQHRLALVREITDAHPLNPQTDNLTEVMKQLDIHDGFDVGLEMSGSPAAFNQMLDSMRAGGKIVLLGFLPNNTEIPWSQLNFKGLTLKGIWGREMYQTWYKMISLLENGLNVEPIITHRFDVADFEQAFLLMRSGQTGKVILNWE